MSTLQAVPDPRDGLTQRVAEEVRALMARQRVTQTKLAEVLDIPQSSVSERLRGKTPFRLAELERLALLFGVDPVVLLGGTRPPRRPDGDPASEDFQSSHRKPEDFPTQRDAEPEPPLVLAPAA